MNRHSIILLQHVRTYNIDIIVSDIYLFIYIYLINLADILIPWIKHTHKKFTYYSFRV